MINVKKFINKIKEIMDEDLTICSGKSNNHNKEWIMFFKGDFGAIKFLDDGTYEFMT